MPWLARTAVPQEEMESAWEALRQTPVTGKTLAYLHIPFCSNRCLFCNFYRNATRNKFTGPYVDALITEIEQEAAVRPVATGPVHAIYLGGGTPTDLEAKDLARIITTLRRCLPLASDCEITVEARATGSTLEKITACLDAGANRFSFGVQTFDTDVRQRLGRRMNKETLIDFLSRVCALDRAAIVCDLIYGLPHQTEESWLEDIEIVDELELDGVDLYALTLLPASPLASAIDKGTMPAGAAVAEQAERYVTGVKGLEAKGWRQLSSAHFARGTRERNLYNQLIKAGASCLAYGAGAGGSMGGYSYQMTPDLARYRALVSEGKKPLAGLFDSGRGAAAKAIATGGIEAGRLDLALVEAAGVPGFCETALPLAQQWGQAGLLEPDNTIIRLNLSARFWHTNLTGALHQIIDQLLCPPGETVYGGGRPKHVHA